MLLQSKDTWVVSEWTEFLGKQCVFEYCDILVTISIGFKTEIYIQINQELLRSIQIFYGKTTKKTDTIVHFIRLIIALKVYK